MIGGGAIISNPTIPAFGVALSLIFNANISGGGEAGPTIHTSLLADATTNINIGNKTTDAIIVINYYAKRGSLYQMGEITVLNMDTIPDILHEWDDDDIGLTITADMSGDNLRINCLADDSSVDNINFYYVKERVVLL